MLALNSILSRYDVNESGKLEKAQLSRLLADCDASTPVGTPPADGEVEYIMRVADKVATAARGTRRH